MVELAVLSSCEKRPPFTLSEDKDRAGAVVLGVAQPNAISLEVTHLTQLPLRLLNELFCQVAWLISLGDTPCERRYAFLRNEAKLRITELFCAEGEGAASGVRGRPTIIASWGHG